MRLTKARASIRIPRLLLVVISIALAVAGCRVPGTSGSASGSGQLIVGIVPAINNAPLRVGLQEGLFRDHGLSIVVKTYPSLRSEFQALKSGNVNIAEGNYADFFYADATGKASLRLLADGYDATAGMMEVLTLPNSGIASPQDLAHKVVATPEPQLIPSFSGPYSSDIVPYSMETLATESVLVSDGVTPTTTTWKPMPVQDMIGALRRGLVNAILAPEPYVIEAESRLGAVEVMDSCSGLTANLPLSGYFSLATYASGHGAQLQQFRSALSAAQADASNRGALQAMLPHFTGMNAQAAALATFGTFPTSLSVDQVQRVADLMYQSGVISKPLTVRSLVSG